MTKTKSQRAWLNLPHSDYYNRQLLPNIVHSQLTNNQDVRHSVRTRRWWWCWCKIKWIIDQNVLEMSPV